MNVATMFCLPLKHRREIPIRLVCDANSDASGGPIEDLNGVPIPAELLDMKKSSKSDEPLAFPSGVQTSGRCDSSQTL